VKQITARKNITEILEEEEEEKERELVMVIKK
jgi:hypothetical protein